MPWTYKPSLSVPRRCLAAATDTAPAPASGSRIYAIGGVNADMGAAAAVFATTEAYDTSAQSWTTLAAMPTARGGLAAASGAEGVHALGGSDITSILATHEIYHPATDAWSPAPSLPTARMGLAAATGQDGLIYAIGGGSGGQYSSAVEAYDPSTGHWLTKAAMPTPRAFLAAVTGHDGTIYAIGGFGSSGATLPTVEAYSPSAGTWTTEPLLPVPGCLLAAAVDPKGLIYAIGAFNSGSNVYSYDPAHPSTGWTAAEPLLALQYSLCAATGADGLIYAIGGQTLDSTGAAGPVVSTVEAYAAPPPPDPCAELEAELADLSPGDFPNFRAYEQARQRVMLQLAECRRAHGV